MSILEKSLYTYKNLAGVYVSNSVPIIMFSFPKEDDNLLFDSKNCFGLGGSHPEVKATRKSGISATSFHEQYEQ